MLYEVLVLLRFMCLSYLCVMFGVFCVPVNYCRMELVYLLCIVTVTLISIGVILPSPIEAYRSSSFYHMYTVPGKFNHSYELNVSRISSVSILYNQSRHQVMLFLLHDWLWHLIVKCWRMMLHACLIYLSNTFYLDEEMKIYACWYTELSTAILQTIYRYCQKT